MDQMYDAGTKQEPQQVMWIKKKKNLYSDTLHYWWGIFLTTFCLNPLPAVKL